MAQIFHPSTNTFAKATIFGAVFILAGLGWAWGAWLRSDYATQVDVARDQPVPFSHDHHVSGLGIDCRYCHWQVETSSFAGVPATEVCMGCHSQIWKDSPLLAPVRESFRTGEPLRWTRVHDLPDFAYFDHSIHVAKGIGCESCHGRIDRMQLTRKAFSLQMEWCLECHRHPERNVREPDKIFAFGLSSPQRTDPPRLRSETMTEPVGGHDPAAEKAAASTKRRSGEQLVSDYGIVAGQLTDCVICHR